MMDIENTWQQSKGSDDDLSMLLKSDFSNLHSKLPLRKLKKNLATGIILAILITVFYIILLFVISIWQVQSALVILIIFNSWVIFESWKLYKNTNDTISPSFSLKQELEKNYNSFQKWWSIQEKVSLYIYPISCTGGFILGGVEGSGKSVETFLQNPKILAVLAITLLILVPICYFGARWMFYYAYGKYLKQIKTFIVELSSEKDNYRGNLNMEK